MSHRGEPARGAPSERHLPPEAAPAAWRWLCVVVAASVWVAVYLAQLAGSEFFADDFLYLQLARTGPVDLEWFAIGNYGHFAPVTRLAYLLLERWGDLDYRLAAVVPAALATVVFLALVWMGRALLGRRALVLVLAVLGATSVPLVRVALWWGAGVHVLGAAACMTLCVAAFVAYCRGGSRVALATSVVALGAGLLVQERPLLTVGYLVLVRYLFRLGESEDDRFTPRWFAREARLWTPFAVVTLVYLFYRLFIFDSAPTPGSLHEALLFLASGTVRSYLPSLVGIRSPADAGWMDLPTILGLLLLVAVGWYVGTRYQGVWRCAAFLGATYLANIAVVAGGRLGVGDAALQSFDLQYFVDVHIATVMTVLLGLGALSPRPSPTVRWRRGVRPALAGATACVLVTTAFQWHSIVTNNQQTPAHQYVSRARSELLEQRTDFDLLRFMVPRTVAPNFIDPYTDQPGIFSLVGAVRDRLSPTSRRKLVVVDSGHLRTAHPVTLAEVPGGSKAIRVATGSRATARGSETCVSGRRRSGVTVALPGDVVSPGLFFQISYSSPSPVRLRAAAGGPGGASFNAAPTTLPRGQDLAVVDRLDAQQASMLSLNFRSRVRDLCIHSVWLGSVAADDGAGCRILDHTGTLTDEPADCSKRWPR